MPEILVPEIRVQTTSPEQTRELGASIAAGLEPGDVVMLSGDLGAGKTCLVQGAARALGVRARVQSPSFVIVREYQGDVNVAHVDVYRLESLQELDDLGYEELFETDRIVFVEWGDAVAGALPRDRIEVDIVRADDDTRSITVRAPSARLQRMASA